MYLHNQVNAPVVKGVQRTKRAAPTGGIGSAQWSDFTSSSQPVPSRRPHLRAAVSHPDFSQHHFSTSNKRPPPPAPRLSKQYRSVDNLHYPMTKVSSKGSVEEPVRRAKSETVLFREEGAGRLRRSASGDSVAAKRMTSTPKQSAKKGHWKSAHELGRMEPAFTPLRPFTTIDHPVSKLLVKV